MEMRTRSAWMAVATAPAVVAEALIRQLTNGTWWPYWTDDVLVAILLAVAGGLVLKEATSTRARLLSAAWGGMLFVLWGSTFAHMEALPVDREVYAPHLTLITILMVGLLAVAALGLGWSLPTTKRPFIGTRPPKEERTR